MSRTFNTTIDELTLDNVDSIDFGYSRTKYKLINEGTGYPFPATGAYFNTTLTLEKDIGRYVIEGRFNGNNILLDASGYTSLINDMPVNSWIDVFVCSSNNNAAVINPIGNVRINDGILPTATFNFVGQGLSCVHIRLIRHPTGGLFKYCLTKTFA